MPKLARLVRKKAPPVELGESEIMSVWDRKEFRGKLWVKFAEFVRENGAWVITPPADGNVRVQIPDGSELLQRLAPFRKYPVAYVGEATRLSHGKFVRVSEYQVRLWRDSTQTSEMKSPPERP
jgi:hypothetical protein